MIARVSANQPSFKEVQFGAGFNVVLAERSEESRERDSRNGSGKTTLIEVIHFCLGSTADGGHPLLRPELASWRFDTQFDARGESIGVSRSSGQPARIQLSTLPPGAPVVLREEDQDHSGGKWLPNDEWRGAALSWLLFGMSDDERARPHAPSARTLLSYFARRGRDAFSNPFTFFRSQPSYQRQVANAYLLGLDWYYPTRAHELREQGDRLTKARQALVELRLDGSEGNDGQTLEGELEARVIILSRELDEAAEQLRSFRVHPQYDDLEKEASQLTRELHDLAADNVSERELVAFYERSLAEEQPAAPEALEAMYAEAGVVFPDSLRHHLDEVREFYTRLLANRRSYLEGEIGRLGQSISARDTRVAELSERRSRLMAVLGEHGALAEFQRLQELHNEKAGELERLRGQLEQLQRFEEEISKIRLAKDQLVLDARTAFSERRPAWSEAVEIFGANTAALYEEPGRLAINVNDDGGLNFSYDMARGESQGVQEMMVFCYDLMVAELWSQKEASPGFLIHDSTIFDGVDERQVAQALQLAARKSEELGFQYICLLNSDAVPHAEFDESFDFKSRVVLELSDLGEDGGLFGIRF